VADIGRRLGVPLVVDNTSAPVLCKPLAHGAAVVVYSTTKYIGGHGTSIGGVIVDGGNFDWEKHAERFPLLNTPDPSYHGAIWTQAVKPLGPIAYIIKARVTLLRDLGSAIYMRHRSGRAGVRASRACSSGVPVAEPDGGVVALSRAARRPGSHPSLGADAVDVGSGACSRSASTRASGAARGRRRDARQRRGAQGDQAARRLGICADLTGQQLTPELRALIQVASGPAFDRYGARGCGPVAQRVRGGRLARQRGNMTSKWSAMAVPRRRARRASCSSPT
jgi:hypothetical protein